MIQLGTSTRHRATHCNKCTPDKLNTILEGSWRIKEPPTTRVEYAAVIHIMPFAQLLMGGNDGDILVGMSRIVL